MLTCPNCGDKRLKIADKSAIVAALLLIAAGLISGTAIIAAVMDAMIGRGSYWLAGIGGVILFVSTMGWFTRKRFVYQCAKCGQKIRANRFGIS
jgi:DNA-directed RNA polymerase subunit RPC12/RpoP